MTSTRSFSGFAIFPFVFGRSWKTNLPPLILLIPAVKFHASLLRLVRLWKRAGFTPSPGRTVIRLAGSGLSIQVRTKKLESPANLNGGAPC